MLYYLLPIGTGTQAGGHIAIKFAKIFAVLDSASLDYTPAPLCSASLASRNRLAFPAVGPDVSLWDGRWRGNYKGPHHVMALWVPVRLSDALTTWDPGMLLGPEAPASLDLTA